MSEQIENLKKLCIESKALLKKLEVAVFPLPSDIKRLGAIQHEFNVAVVEALEGFKK